MEKSKTFMWSIVKEILEDNIKYVLIEIATLRLDVYRCNILLRNLSDSLS